MNRNAFGAFGFFGLNKFVEFNLGILVKVPGDFTVTQDGESYTWSASEMGLDSVGSLQLGAYGKYPFPISDRFVFFPTAGIDLELSFSEDWWHDLWIRGGAGLDVFFSERLFLRSHLIYGVSIPMGGKSDLGDWRLQVGHGLLIKVGMGWML